MRVIAMYRVSTEAQASDGTSLDAQQRIYREHAQRYGWSTIAEFRGQESATQATADRKVLQQVLAAIREYEPDALYVHEQSRLSRGDELDVALLFRELRERRVKIIVNGVVRDLASIDERFMIGIQSLVDRAESERIKERMQRGKRERARQGRIASGAAPFGYINPPKGMPGRGTMQIVPEEAIVVRKIFELAASGMGDRAIVNALEAMGARSSRGKKWCRNSVRRTIQNPAYIGTCASGVWVGTGKKRSFKFDPANPKAILVPNAHLPIVDQALFDAVNKRTKLPRTARPRLLSGLLHLNGVPAHGDCADGRSYYRGPRGRKGNPWLDTAMADEVVWDAFIRLATEPRFLEKLIAQAQNPHKQVMLAQEIEWLQDRIRKTTAKVDRLIEMRSDGELDKETFLKKSAEQREALADLQKQLGEQQAKAVVFDATHAQRIVRAVQVLLGGRTKLGLDQKRQVMRSVVRRIDIAAEYHKRDFKRQPNGKILPGRAPRWAVTGIKLHLTLPAPDPLGDAPREAVGQTVASGEGEPALTASQAGHLATTGSDWAPEPEFAGCRAGLQDTTSLCWGPPGRGRR